MSDFDVEAAVSPVPPSNNKRKKTEKNWQTLFMSLDSTPKDTTLLLVAKTHFVC